MKLIVNPHTTELEPSLVNEKEVNITQIEIEYNDIPTDYVKDVYFTLNEKTYTRLNVQNTCTIPPEVLKEKGTIEIGIVISEIMGDELIARYNPSPSYFDTLDGSLKDTYENSEPITPTDKEQIMQALNNMNIDGNKVGKITTITISYKDGTTKTLTLEDGMGLEYNWLGTSLGIKREDEVNYEYVDLKGDKGEPGAIKMVIVNQLPSTGAEDTIYLVPLATPESQENNYAEYIYINGNWELLGKIGIQVDLTDYALKSEIPTQLSQLTDDSTHRLVSDTEKTTWGGKYDKPGTGIPKTDLASDVQTSLGKADTALQEHQSLANYVKKTDYGTTNNGGTIKSGYSSFFINNNGQPYAQGQTYQTYVNSMENTSFISKGTLENVITGKDLTTKAYVDGLVGDISSVLDLINNEVI